MQISVETSRFGTLEVDEDRIIQFPWGIPGFEDIKRYVLLEHEQGMFHWLQAVDDSELAFIVCMPGILNVAYNIPQEKTRIIQVKDPVQLAVLNLVSIVGAPQKTIRFHIRSPLLVNMEARLAYQWTMDAADIQKYVTIPEGVTLSRDSEEQDTSLPESFIVWQIVDEKIP